MCYCHMRVVVYWLNCLSAEVDYLHVLNKMGEKVTYLNECFFLQLKTFSLKCKRSALSFRGSEKQQRYLGF